jgi:predicted RNase H-like nuclease
MGRFPPPGRGGIRNHEWMSSTRVLGVDACRAGWIGIALSGVDPRGVDPRGVDPRPYVAPTIRELAEQAAADGPLRVIAIDIPIGLADTGRRRADRLAREALGRRWPSLFITPVREAVLLGDFPAAQAANRRLAGEGISRQAFALSAKILDVDEWLRGISPPRARVVEAHPELSFAELAGAPLAVRKSTWAGAEMRRTLLARAGITLTGDLGLAGEQAGVDDVLDAAAAAWTAWRVSQGSARCLPDPPETFSDGLPSAIWT